MLNPGSDIPKGVRFKKTTTALNQKATASLNKLFTAKSNPTIQSSKVVVCGPNLWKAIKRSAPAILTKAQVLIFMVPTGDQVKRFTGMRFRTADEQAAFWKLLHSKYGTPKPGIRKAAHDEIGYYWSIIPYDIEEPLLVVVSGKSRLLFDFTIEKGPTSSLHRRALPLKQTPDPGGVQDISRISEIPG